MWGRTPQLSLLRLGQCRDRRLPGKRDAGVRRTPGMEEEV